MAETEIPQYFVCPISLQIMKDPVTATTGITYDRESIENWLKKARDCTCPVTKQPLPRDSDLTPNLTLRRLIQAWCSANAFDRIPTPKSPLDKAQVQKLLSDLQIPCLYETSLRKMHYLAAENERNRTCMVEASVAKAMVPIIMKSFKEGKTTSSLQDALRILRLLWNPTSLKPLVSQNSDFINSLTQILQLHMNNDVVMVNEVMPVLKSTVEVADSTVLGGLKLQFFKAIVRALKNRSLSQQTIKSALHVLIETCPLGRNRMRMVEAGAVFEFVELELEKPEKRVTELIFNLLAHLCSCADGREQFLQHAGSIAMVSKRILRVSPGTDDRAINIYSLIAKYSASSDVVSEMLRVGAVSKLCMVLQADCASYLKEKARGILRLHSKAWNNSPCIQVYLLTRQPLR